MAGGSGQPRFRVRSRDERGATLVEFALIMPLLFMLLFGIVEFGRFVATAAAVNTASREAARFGSAAGLSTNGIPRYTDCDEIRNAGQRLAIVVNLAVSDIAISYDEGPSTGQTTTCPPGMPPNAGDFNSGDRIVVTVTTQFQSSIPIIGNFIGTVNLSSTDRRTIFKG